MLQAVTVRVQRRARRRQEQNSEPRGQSSVIQRLRGWSLDMGE